MNYMVMATHKGYYGVLREPGEIFQLKAKEDFSKRWMRKMSKETPPTREIEDYQDPRITHKPPPEPLTYHDVNQRRPVAEQTWE